MQIAKKKQAMMNISRPYLEKKNSLSIGWSIGIITLVVEKLIESSRGRKRE